MRKRIVVRGIDPIEIVFRDKTFICTINNDALMFFTENYGDIMEVIDKDKDRPYDFAAKILYCGIYVNQREFKYEDAEAIVAAGGMSVVAQLFDNMLESFMTNASEEEKNAYLGELERLLKSTQ